MKKVFDQTVRDLKREVNKKVLKVPGIEQKVLDITSNEPWGPHGSIMADIAQATRNYHEYQIIMSILWKRLNDTGKNWRHVYKALTVLEYLVGHGSERVIDDLREHAYQISTLKEFQYIDSHGRDQGQNVRKKSHALVTLLNDKERIREAREKAAVNRDKFKSASSTGGPYRPGYGGDNFEEDRYATRRDDDRNGYGREVERYRDDDRDGRNGDSATGRDGAPRYSYGKDSGERYGRDGDNYRDEDVGGDRDNEDGRYARKTEKERDQNYDDYERGSRPSDYSPQHDKYGQKQPGGNSGAPPSYEEAVSDSSNNTNDRDKGSVESAAAKATAQYAAKSQSQNATTYTENAANPVIKPVDEFDDFDPRNSFSATPAPNSQTEVDLFGSATELLALPAPNTTAAGVPSTENNLSADIFGNDAFPPSSSGFSNTGFAASSTSSGFSPPPPATDSQFQAGQNPFGDPPFKVSFTSDDSNTQPPSENLPPLSFSVDSSNPHNASFSVGNQATSALDPLQPNPPNPFGEVTPPFQSSADSFQTRPPPAFPGNQQSQVPVPQPPQASFTQPPQASFAQPPQASFTQPPQASFTQPPQASFTQPPQASFTQPPQASFTQPPQASFTQHPQASFTQPPQASFTQPPTYSFNQVSQPPLYSQNQPQQQAQPILPNALEQKPVPAPVQRTQSLPFDLDSIQPLSSNVSTMKPQASSFMNTSTAMDISSQQKKDKFETKSAIWADTLSKGLVDLNISGPKINPLADIGIDFDSINRKEKRRGDRERTSISSVPSSNNNLPMGRAMGSGRGNAVGGGQPTSMPGSMGIGMVGGGYGMGANSAGAGMGRGMGMAGPGMGMGGNPGMGMAAPGMGMGGNPGMGMAAPGMGMGMAQGAGMGMNMGMGVNPAAMGMNPGMGMRPPMAMQPGQGVNPMMGGYGGMPGGGMNPMMGGYGSHQQPGGFR